MMRNTWKPFEPKSGEPYPISRTKIAEFRVCARCFYLDIRRGIKQPEKHSPFALNLAVDALLKKEFDIYRRLGQPHPAMTEYGINGIPYLRPEPEVFEKWRSNYTGMRYLHDLTNFIVYGAPDDVWLVHTSTCSRLSVADYKAGSSKVPLNEKDYWKDYTDQAEIYTWLLERMDTGIPVSDTAYFLSANGNKDRERFDNRLEFDLSVIEHRCKTDWVEPTLIRIKECLMSDAPPPSSPQCNYCEYRRKTRAL